VHRFKRPLAAEMDDEEQSGAGPGAIAIRNCASWPGIARAIACASMRQRRGFRVPSGLVAHQLPELVFAGKERAPGEQHGEQCGERDGAEQDVQQDELQADRVDG
jgi:hypothetical protein